MACLALFAAMPILFTSCSSYDEDDCTIIEYLKINDLLEKKLAGNSADEVLDFMQDLLINNQSIFSHAIIYARYFQKSIVILMNYPCKIKWQFCRNRRPRTAIYFENE